MSAGVITGVLLVFLLLGYLVYALINAGGVLMAAQGFLLIATFFTGVNGAGASFRQRAGAAD